MCDRSNNPGGREAAMVEAYPGAWCDPCIAPLVKALNESDLPSVPSRLNPDGIRTVASCCGHGKWPGKIALADGRELFVLPDFVSARKLEAALSADPELPPCDGNGMVPAPADHPDWGRVQ